MSSDATAPDADPASRVDSTPAPGHESPPTPGHARLRALGILLVGTAVMIIAALVGIIATGASNPGTLVPVPELVVWGTPVVRALHHLGMLLAIGGGGVTVLLLPGHGRRRSGTAHTPAGRSLTRLAAAGAALWTAAGLALIPLGGMEAAGAGSGLDPWQVALSTDLGRIRLTVVVLAALAALVFALARGTVLTAWGLAFGGLGVFSLGFAGHAGARLDHINAVNAMCAHLLGVTVWVGGLLTLLLGRRVIGEDMPIVVRRFSPWALGAVITIAVGGTISAAIRVGNLHALVTTPYGLLIVVKATLLIGLAVLGAQQRRVLGNAVSFRHLALTEGVLMAVVLGVSIALGRSAPIISQQVQPDDAALQRIALVGFDVPSAPFGVRELFTQWQMDWMSLAIALALATLYLIGVVRLARRGDSWQWYRTAPWLAGCLALVWVLSGGPGAYGHFRFDAHMVQHMALMMIVPPLWVLGAPVTLLTRAVAPRTDGSRGVREWVLAALHSRYAQIVSLPPVAGTIFAGSLVLFYFTPIFQWSQYTHLGHVIMVVHFLMAGYLFAWVLIGVDPTTHPINPVLKLVTLLVTLSFHAFFGVAVISATWIIAGDWYRQIGLFSLDQLTTIQERGGSIMWGVSEIPTLFYAIILALMWTTSDERRAKQWDRKADRDGEAELAAYNAYLESLRGKDDGGRL